MKRALALITFVAAILLGSGSAVADAPDTTGPPCADLGGAFGFYGPDGSGNAVFTIEVTTHSPTCRVVDYTLHEADGRFADQTQAGTDSTVLIYTVDLGPEETAPTEICVYFTSQIGQHIADRSPNAEIRECVVYEFDPESGPGGEGFDQ